MLLEYWYNELWAQDWYHYETGLRETAHNMLMSISNGERRNEVKLKQGGSLAYERLLSIPQNQVTCDGIMRCSGDWLGVLDLKIWAELETTLQIGHVTSRLIGATS